MSDVSVRVTEAQSCYQSHTLVLGSRNMIVCDVLQCSDDRRSLRATVSSSMLGESVTEEEAELGSRKDSLERLLCSVEEAGQLDDALLEDKQVDDFASSVLAAISCWHVTVQAFFSAAGTVRLSGASPVFITRSPCNALQGCCCGAQSNCFMSI